MMSSTCRVATSHGLCRGWFTYGDLCTLLENAGFLRTLSIFRLEVLKVRPRINILKILGEWDSQISSEVFILTLFTLNFSVLGKCLLFWAWLLQLDLKTSLKFILNMIYLHEVFEYMKDHIFELQRKIWRHDWSLQLYTQLKQLIFFTTYLYIIHSQLDQLPVGMLAQLAEHCAGGIAQAMGWNPIYAWISVLQA